MASSKHLVLPLKPINIKKPNTRPYIYKERYDYYGLYKTDERLTRWHKYYRDWVQERYEKKPFIKYNVMRQGGYPLVSNRFAEPWKSKNEQVKPSSPQYSQNGEFNLGLAPILPHRERRCSTYGQNRIWQNTYYPPNIGN